MKQKFTFKHWATVILSLCLAVTGCIGYFDYTVPSSVSVFQAQNATQEIENAIVSFSYRDECRTQGEYITSMTGQASLFGFFPIKDVTVNVCDQLELYPGGMTFGIQMQTDGVMIVGLTTVQSDGNTRSPAQEAGLRPKDMLLQIDNTQLFSADDLTSALNQSQGKAMQVRYRRDGHEESCTLQPVRSDEDGMYKAGIWIRDATSGIGTVTFLLDDGSFAGLGHGICDTETGMLLPLRSGNVTGVTISGIARGQTGQPGEIKGYLSGDVCGSLYANRESGLYGKFDTLPSPCHEKLPIGLMGEMRNGDATILSGVSGEVKEYTVRISDVGRGGNGDSKNFIVTVTDPELLERTGGIVQGMSGSPVIQDGKIVGAVTHVLINDPKKGYGIYIENMLKNMES